MSVDKKKKDWRLEQLQSCNNSTGFGYHFRAFPQHPEHQHDHCGACNALFMAPGTVSHQPFITAGYELAEEHDDFTDFGFICHGCFYEFHEVMKWRVISNELDFTPKPYLVGKPYG